MRDAIIKTAGYVGMCLPPWNLLCWGAGFAYHQWHEKYGQKDHSGDMALAMVALPAIIPMAILDKILPGRPQL